MRILITGANGLLGTELTKLCIKKGHEVFSGYPTGTPPPGVPIHLDLTDAASVAAAFRQSRPDAVFHCAAMTDVDKCEEDKELATRVNTEGTKTVASLATGSGSRLVYVSTDYVFSGEKGLYREGDPTGPINHYGYTKLMGEREVISPGAEYLIARTSVIYGSCPAMGKVNFALWLVESLRAGKEVTLITDQFVSPTLNTSLASMLLEACGSRLSGIYHMSGAERVSRYDFGIRLAEAFGFDRGLIRPALMEQFAGRWKARRPADSSLDTSKAAGALREKPLVLNQALAELKKEIDAQCSQA